MKEEKRILHALGKADEKYIEEAAPGRKANKKFGWIRWASIAACFAVVIAAALPLLQRNDQNDVPPDTSQTPDNVIPPRAIYANGLHLVQLGYAAQTPSGISADFMIHFNPESYASREENGMYMIRPTTPMSGTFPECSLQITRAADMPPAAAAQSLREELIESHLYVGDITDATAIKGLFFHADNGNAWDAEQVDVTITDDLQGGSYILTARYFTEAAEGHGVRFADMVSTFQAVTSVDADAVPEYLTELYRTISVFLPAFFSDQTAEMSDILAQDAGISTYDADVSDDVGIAAMDYSLSGGESPIGAIVSVKHRINTEDSFNYLTIELTYGTDGRWVIHFAGLEK